MYTTDEKSEEPGSGPISIRPGDYVGDFEIRERLGTGAMGEVFRGFDGKLDREVAIKFLAPALASDEDYLKRFRNEAKLLAGRRVDSLFRAKVAEKGSGPRRRAGNDRQERR